MTLWDVDDERAQEFMVEFYRARTAGSDKEESLRTAGSLIRTKYPDTLDWAAFVLLDQSPRVIESAFYEPLCLLHRTHKLTSHDE